MEEINVNNEGDMEMSDSEEMTAIDKRSERFGTELIREGSSSPVDDLQLYSLYESLGVDRTEYSVKSRWGKYRFNAIHVRGVNDMSTEDLREYFKDFGSPSVEWINDISCNVVWSDKLSATKAMLALSKPILIDSQDKSSASHSNNAEDIFSVKEGELVMLTEDDNGEADEISIDKTLPAEEVKSQLEKGEIESSVTLSNLGIPVPPGLWRYGNPNSKSKAIVMRFATKSDRKLPGAEKRSEYYLKYGNPNYGGMRGIISGSWKRKYRESSKQKEPIVEKKNTKSDGEDEEPNVAKRFHFFGSEESDNQEVKKTKKLRMKMYADEEVKKRHRKVDEDTPYRHTRDLRSHLELHKDRHHNGSRSFSGLSPERSQSRSNVDLRAKIRNRPFVRSESSREASDDLRDKLDLIRQKKKSQHRSPLVIHILEEAKTTS